mgnify:CR=1 FL=1
MQRDHNQEGQMASTYPYLRVTQDLENLLTPKDPPKRIEDVLERLDAVEAKLSILYNLATGDYGKEKEEHRSSDASAQTDAHRRGEG